MATAESIVNALTVDVEDYYHVSAFEGTIRSGDWDRIDARVDRSTRRVLDLLARFSVKATFFTLGWVAERHPDLIRTIVAEGHELASHGYDHTRLTRLDRDAIGKDVTRAKAILEDVGGVAVHGYRAPSFSITAANLWALDLVRTAGYRYSSSIYPVRHDLYGIPDAQRFAYVESGSGMYEIPVSTIAFGTYHLPCGGGGYFRLYPYRFTRWCYRRLNHREREPVVFYTHPWEFDPEQPVQSGISFKTRFRHYQNLKQTAARFERLLQDFRWAPIRDVFPLPAQ